MKAMLLDRLGPVTETAGPLRWGDWPDPVPAGNELLIRVHACGVCHTELDEIEGRTPPASLPMILGHQVAGRVAAMGSGTARWREGDRVGVAWIFSACGQCQFCTRGRENLCPMFQATGRDHFGGYAQLMTARSDFVYRIPDGVSDVEAAPLLCAGAIGYRSLRLTNLEDGQRLGLTGFGASAHLVLKMTRYRYPKSEVFVFARNQSERAFAKELGAAWAGDTSESSPVRLDAIIDTTPAWTPVVEALKNLAPGGKLVINAIRKEAADQESLQRIDYPTHVWMEKEIKSVANVTRRDVEEFLSLAAEMRIQPQIRTFPLSDANHALVELKTKGVPGAKVLLVQ